MGCNNSGIFYSNTILHTVLPSTVTYFTHTYLDRAIPHGGKGVQQNTVPSAAPENAHRPVTWPVRLTTGRIHIEYDSRLKAT